MKHVARLAALAVGAVTVSVLGASVAPAVASSADTRAAQEAAFMRVVDPRDTADAVTGDLMAMAGKHVAYDCYVEEVIRDGVMIGQCGNPDEPIDVFVKLATAHLKINDHLHVLGILEQPAVWSDVTGHVVYYAFLRAVFVDRLRK